MTTFAWPSGLIPRRCDLTLQPNIRAFESPFTRSYQAVDLLGERWRMSVTLPPVRRANAGAREAFLHRLRGVHFVSAWHFAREVPVGTLRGTPTLGSTLQGADTLVINATAGATLKAGDMLGAGGQLFMCAQDVQASAQGALAVPVCNRARAAIAGGAPVTWYRPTVVFRVPDPAAVPHEPGYSDAVSLDLIETW